MKHHPSVSFVAVGCLALAQGAAVAQQPCGRVDIRCLHASNVVTFKTADTNVVIGYGAWRNENPRSTVSAQKIVSSQWTELRFQFSAGQSDTVTLTLRGRYREAEPTGEAVPDWVWVDNVSVTDPDGTGLVRNGSFEKLNHEGRPERWSYKGTEDAIRYDKTGAFPKDGERCLRVSDRLTAQQTFRVRSNTWYTVLAYFRAD